ncbi:MAG: 3-oxoacyl-[acyl-carrier protein] reductase, partial [uncultured Rubrobacteraceae bacterium]
DRGRLGQGARRAPQGQLSVLQGRAEVHGRAG